MNNLKASTIILLFILYITLKVVRLRSIISGGLQSNKLYRFLPNLKTSKLEIFQEF